MRFRQLLLLFKHPWDLGRNFDQLTQTSSLLRVGSVKRKKKKVTPGIYLQAECEARRSKSEAETLQLLSSLRQDNPVLLPKPKPKGKRK